MKKIEIDIMIDENNPECKEKLSSITLDGKEEIHFEGRGKELAPKKNICPLTTYDIKCMMRKPREIKTCIAGRYKLKYDVINMRGGGLASNILTYKKKRKRFW